MINEYPKLWIVDEMGFHIHEISNYEILKNGDFVWYQNGRVEKIKLSYYTELEARLHLQSHFSKILGRLNHMNTCNDMQIGILERKK